MFFRGLVFGALRKRGLGAVLTILLTALLFSVVHFEPMRLLVLLPLGVVILALVRVIFILKTPVRDRVFGGVAVMMMFGVFCAIFYRQMLAIDAQTHDYRQSAIVTAVRPSRPVRRAGRAAS